VALPAVIASGFLLAALAPAIHRRLRGVTGWLLGLYALGITFYFASYIPALADGQVFDSRYDWAPSFGADLHFRLDGLALLFVLLIAGIGSLVFVYAGGYMAGDERRGGLFGLLLMFMSSMLGVVLADNLILLFVFWELTSISSYLLIGFNHERPEARASALQALLVTGGGGLALLAGVILLGYAGENFNLSALLDPTTGLRSRDFPQHFLYVPALVCILAGAFTKSAQFPFHFWLPGAMEAPTPVSAYLHSATMVKAGVYLLARLHPALGDTPLWENTLMIVGGATMLLGGFLALLQTDLKRILAYSTVSALGTLVLLLGLSPGTATPSTGAKLGGAVEASVVFLLAHGLYKGALFMVAGTIDHETGTRNADRLGGLWRSMPITAAAAAIAAVSLAGFGPVLSFIGKEMVLETVLAHRAWYGLAPAAVIAGGLFAAVAGLVAIRPFYGSVRETPKHPHEAPLSMWLGPAVLALLGLMLGIMPYWVDPLVSAAVMAISGQESELHLALWHGWNTALALSGASLLLGIGLYLTWSTIHRHHDRYAWLLRLGPAHGYELSLRALNALAAGQTSVLQSGYLRYYLLIILATMLALVGGTLLSRGNLDIPHEIAEVQFYEFGLVFLILIASLFAVTAKGRLAAIAGLGVVGYSVALVFVLYGAPDVAMTQFLIETLTVILFVLVFYHLPESPELSSRTARVRDAALALVVGALMTALVLVAVDVQYHKPISHYFVDNSVEQAHGRNVVNVILVDFRGLDTLGEITVLSAAAIGVYAMLRLRPRFLAHEPHGPNAIPDEELP
jgi:multicomponent Na+:H+ antiporter subunit A